MERWEHNRSPLWERDGKLRVLARKENVIYIGPQTEPSSPFRSSLQKMEGRGPVRMMSISGDTPPIHPQAPRAPLHVPPTKKSSHGLIRAIDGVTHVGTRIGRVLFTEPVEMLFSGKPFVGSLRLVVGCGTYALSTLVFPWWWPAAFIATSAVWQKHFRKSDMEFMPHPEKARKLRSLQRKRG